MPFNSRKMRHHRPIQLEILYYPQVVTRRSGPTGTIPYSHYWHLNHEENHDNFAGAGALPVRHRIQSLISALTWPCGGGRSS